MSNNNLDIYEETFYFCDNKKIDDITIESMKNYKRIN